jgi:hypothetical protein
LSNPCASLLELSGNRVTQIEQRISGIEVGGGRQGQAENATTTSFFSACT